MDPDRKLNLKNTIKKRHRKRYLQVMRHPGIEPGTT